MKDTIQNYAFKKFISEKGYQVFRLGRGKLDNPKVDTFCFNDLIVSTLHFEHNKTAFLLKTMAKNTGRNFRIGSVDNRSQTQNPKTNNWVKRDTTTGRFTDVKSGGKPFKGVAKETDDRRS